LDLDDPLFCMPKPGHFVHACRDAHDRPVENQEGSQQGPLDAGPGDADWSHYPSCQAHSDCVAQVLRLAPPSATQSLRAWQLDSRRDSADDGVARSANAGGSQCSRC
jgi:hypothetical protein